jgi:hypothetical protein
MTRIIGAGGGGAAKVVVVVSNVRQLKRMTRCNPYSLPVFLICYLKGRSKA